MKSLRWAVILVLPALFVLGSDTAQGEPEQLLPIKVICYRGCNRNSDSYVRIIGTQLARFEPDWREVEQNSRDLVRMGKLLAQHKPPRGDLESWRKLTDLYTARATLVVDAVEQRDKDTALKQLRLVVNCRACHQAHK